jgi:hypothetical protein
MLPCSVLNLDRLDGAGLGGFTTGILEFFGDGVVEATDRQVVLHFEDIRADLRAAFRR